MIEAHADIDLDLLQCVRAVIKKAQLQVIERQAFTDGVKLAVSGDEGLVKNIVINVAFREILQLLEWSECSHNENQIRVLFAADDNSKLTTV
ncbi:hypothetical protein PANT111_560076 [Pantoea brenneri]|uniref:Uncharacterized protein n=1 Tax=Pantoea brenneri TaxID=472694 RepID=A0AAX3JC58_9GAMM|nr:hypothetical protein PANT111_560076 [Pantoea brenneri]